MFRLLGAGLLCFSLALGCASTPSPDDQSLTIEDASVTFDRHFPKAWPAKPVPLPLSDSDKRAINEMISAVTQKLESENVSYEALSPYKIKILPQKNHALNHQALDLKSDDIALVYDAYYFAKNPFSEGTFNDETKELLISHTALQTEEATSSLLAHEMVHVETYRDRKRRKQSPYYCRFKGPQFAPHYLACDEMKAYNQDLARMMADDRAPASIEKRLKVAKTHTDSIPALIEKLDFSSLTIVEDVASIKGTDNGKIFTVEFPSFVLENNGKTNTTAKEYLGNVTQVAQAYKDFLANVKTD